MNNISTSNGKIEKLWSRDYIFLMIANFFLFFGDCLLLPVLPVYVKQNGANNFQVGVVAAVFFATSILMRIFTTRVSARLGKKTLLMMAIAVFGLAMLGYYLFAGLIVIIILRLIQGLGFGAATPLYGTMVADIIPSERMGEGMGYFGLGISIAMVLGPFLGAFSVSLVDYKWVFLVAVLLEMIAMLLSVFIKTDNHRKTVEKKVGIRGFLSDFIEPKAFFPAFFVLLIGLATGGFSTYIVLFGKQMNINNISIYFLVMALAEFFVRLFSGKLYDKKGVSFVVVPGAIMGVIGCAVIANATNLAMVCISAIFCGMAYGVIFPVMEAVAMKSAGSERRIAANATLYNFLDIGTGLGPLLFGAVVQTLGYRDAFSVSGLIFIVMLVIITITALNERRNKVFDFN